MAAVLRNPRLRREMFWVACNKAVELTTLFVTLKVLTNFLSKAGFGEFNLALTSLMLLDSILIVPMNRAFQRHYHTSEERGTLRSTAMALFRWYTVVTVAVALGGCIFSISLSGWFGLETWTAMAAGIYFMANRWRALGVETLDIRRQRRKCAVHNGLFLLSQLALVFAAIYFIKASASAALFAYAIAAVICSLIVAVPLVRRMRVMPEGTNSEIMRMVWSFGLPFGALMVFQWVQNFADRYIIAGQLDFQSAGLYVAAYQVCGIPYMLLLNIMYSLLMPIAYQRARDIDDPRQLWSADRVLLAGVAAYLGIGASMLLVYGFWGRQLIVLLTSKGFALPLSIIMFLTLCRYVQCLGMLFQLFFAVHHQIKRLLWFRAIGAIITVPICWFAVRSYDITGAAVGALLAGTIYVALVCLGRGGCAWEILSSRSAARNRPST
ncbi:MAG: oligosaccharide flippase family protein [Planctomycetota bacterium]|nr:oligosaccharide flippase family protein [Planctomycetota bacterium]